MHTETPFFYCIIKKLYQFFNQGKSISKLDKINPFQSNKKYFSTYHNIVDASTAIENAYSVHDTLSKILGDKMCFFETTKRDFKISPIDIIAYAFLKEELMLIPDSQSTQSLSTSFRNLQDFVTIFDKVFKEKKYPIYSNLKIDIKEIAKQFEAKNPTLPCFERNKKADPEPSTFKSKMIKVSISLALFSALICLNIFYKAEKPITSAINKK